MMETTALQPLPSPEPGFAPTSEADAIRSAAQLRAEMAERFYAYDEVRRLPSNDRDALFQILQEAQHGETALLRDIYGLVYDEVPVPLEEFVCGRRYLGLGKNIDPVKLELLIRIADPHLRKAWLAIGSGGGKSFMVSIVQAWTVYNLLCLKRPDLFYMLGPGSKIAAVNLSVAKEQAKDVVFAEFVGRLSHAPWFTGKFEPQVGKCLFPKDVFAISGGSSATSFYGYHTIQGAIDEASYLLDREGRSLAEELVEALLKSLTTRFPNSYKLLVISTLRSDDDFLYANIQRVKEDGIDITTSMDARLRERA
jgi:hypothetical protein